MMKKFILILLMIGLSSGSVIAASDHTRAKHANTVKKHHRLHTKHHRPVPTKKHYIANVQDNVPHVALPKPSRWASFESILVNFVSSTVDTLRYSVYKLGGRHFDTTRGVYILDCSDYVDNILQAVFPNAYNNLVDSTGAPKPTSQHYYDFFSSLGGGSNQYWNKINDVEALQPGDILVFRTKNALGTETGGHVMVVMNKPIPDENVYLVRVADSAPSGHSQDTRQANASGIGIGNLLLKVNPNTGAPAAYAWRVGARWKKNVNFAMARPVGSYY